MKHTGYFNHSARPGRFCFCVVYTKRLPLRSTRDVYVTVGRNEYLCFLRDTFKSGLVLATTIMSTTQKVLAATVSRKYCMNFYRNVDLRPSRTALGSRLSAPLERKAVYGHRGGVFAFDYRNHVQSSRRLFRECASLQIFTRNFFFSRTLAEIVLAAGSRRFKSLGGWGRVCSV